MISSGAACVTTLHGRSVDESNFLDLISSMDYHTGARFIMDKLAFHKSSFEWDSVCLVVLRILSSPRASP